MCQWQILLCVFTAFDRTPTSMYVHKFLNKFWHILFFLSIFRSTFVAGLFSFTSSQFKLNWMILFHFVFCSSSALFNLFHFWKGVIDALLLTHTNVISFSIFFFCDSVTIISNRIQYFHFNYQHVKYVHISHIVHSSL